MSQKKVRISYGDGETHTSILESEGLKLKVPLSELEGKMICLFFSAKSCRPCRNFTPQLIHLYNSVDRRKLEIILVSLDKDEVSFSEHTKNMPWLIAAAAAAVAAPPPPHDQFEGEEEGEGTSWSSMSRRLCDRYRVKSIPSLIPLASDGRRVEEDAVQLVEEYGVDAFPFDANRRYQLEAMDDAKRRGPVDLQQLLLPRSTPPKKHNNNNNNNYYVISRDHGKQIPVADLAGKTIGLYFGARWCPPSRTFTTMLLETYNNDHHIVMTKKSSSSSSSSSRRRLEIIFISMDRDEEEFKLSLEEMPWLAVPYLELQQTRKDLCRIYNVKTIPQLVLLGPHGRNTLTTDGRALLIMIHYYNYYYNCGRSATSKAAAASSFIQAAPFPFGGTEEEEEEVVEELMRKEGEGLPCQVSDPRHGHLLRLDTAKAYICDACRHHGRYWVFSCPQCDFDLHPACTYTSVSSCVKYHPNNQ